MPEPVSILGTISAALTILKDAPGAFDALKRLGVNISYWLQAPKPAIQVDPNTPSGMIVIGLDDELKRLINKFFEADKNDRWGQDEKDNARKRIAKQACDLLTRGKTILRPHTADYEELKEFFCSF